MSYGTFLGVDAIAPRYVREVVAQEMTEGGRRGWRRRILNADVLGAYPATAIALGDDGMQADLTRNQQALHDLAVSIAAAHAAGNTQAEAGLRAQFNAVKAIVDEQVAALRSSEGPSSLESAVANVGGFFKSLGGNVALAAGVGLALLVVVPMLSTRRS
jgi:hypothetical protein